MNVISRVSFPGNNTRTISRNLLSKADCREREDQPGPSRDQNRAKKGIIGLGRVKEGRGA